jgi:integrase
MSPAWIRKRVGARGTSFQVLYRRGGRAYPIESAGTFGVKREAQLRRDLVGGWLAQALNPKLELARLHETPVARPTYRDVSARYRSSRIDVAGRTLAGIDSALVHFNRIFGDRDPHTLTVADQIEAVADLAGRLAPRSVARYFATHKLILDFAGCDPNPARDRAVKMPTADREEANPPTAAQFLTLLHAMSRRYTLVMVVLEQTGMRVGEVCSLEWGDVDEDGGRFRLRSGATKTRRARWVQVPSWLMVHVAATVAREDRAEGRRVFAGIKDEAIRTAMARACRTAGLPQFSPHDLRHRRGTIWHQDPSVTLREQMDRGGWSSSDIAIETYSHLMVLDEVPAEALDALLVVTR